MGIFKSTKEFIKCPGKFTNSSDTQPSGCKLIQNFHRKAHPKSVNHTQQNLQLHNRLNGSQMPGKKKDKYPTDLKQHEADVSAAYPIILSEAGSAVKY